MTAEHTLRVTLDLATVESLQRLGDPAEVLALLARSAAAGAAAPHRDKRARTDESLRAERATVDDEADAGAPRGTVTNARLATERVATDKDLNGERAHVDHTSDGQREANAEMVKATLRAQELTGLAEAAQERLDRSARELRELGQLRETFMGVLGHDMRNPLGSILMSAEGLLRRGHLVAGDREPVERVLRGAQRIKRLVSQLLDLTRARLGGGLTVELKATDLGEVCRNVIAEFETHVALELSGELQGSWDPDRLEAALSNLVGNALEYSTPGCEVTVAVRPEGDALVVAVRNHGPPIPPDVLPFIFEPFRRAKPKEKSKEGNLGLGLYIAQQAARAHGGELTVQSGAGETTFLMRLPRGAPVTEPKVL